MNPRTSETKAKPAAEEEAPASPTAASDAPPERSSAASGPPSPTTDDADTAAPAEGFEGADGDPAQGAAPEHAEIATRAYYLHLEDENGDEVEIWLRAERELTSRRGLQREDAGN
jgi:hypothetical protein